MKFWENLTQKEKVDVIVCYRRSEEPGAKLTELEMEKVAIYKVHLKEDELKEIERQAYARRLGELKAEKDFGIEGVNTPVKL